MTDASGGVFTLAQPERESRLLPRLVELTAHHRANSAGYARILAALGHDPVQPVGTIADLPWLPAGLFKEHKLASIPDDAVFQVLTSSGTTGQPSRIYLDRAAAAATQRALARTLRTVIGPRRLPMLVIDSAAVLARQPSMSARGAGVLGMMAYGRDHAFALDDSGQPSAGEIRRFLRRHGGGPFLIFGFTSLVWQYLLPVARSETLDLSGGLLLHSGGWKRLTERQVSNTEFRCRCGELGLRRICNFYGMVEQIGTVFLEGGKPGELYCPDFADVIIRDAGTWAEAPAGTPGVIEVVSELPTSYPGHVLLTEDLGIVHGVDDGEWPGKRFSVLGRVPRAEPRGCSDTGSDSADMAA
jgi:hypothetical protein